MVRIAVIGVGYLGQHHARIFSELEGVKLAAVVDIDRERAEKISKKYGAIPFTDFREALSGIDAVSIVTPTVTHYTIAKECIKAGKDILIEKPVTDEVREADDLINAALKRGVVAQVGHLERFNPAVLAIYPLIESPRFFEAERLSPFLGRGIDVDITLDLMIHDIDIILAILSQNNEKVAVKDIKATVASVLTEKIDVAKVWLEFTNGTQALMTASRLSFEKSRKLKIFQKYSYLHIDYQKMEIKRFFKENNQICHKSVHVEKKEPLKEELKDFIACVCTRRRPVVSLEDGRNALQVALQIVKKIEDRVEV